MIAEGYKVEAFILPDETELAGVNTEEDLKEVERILKKEQM
jgi:bifunctional N-acetylglucosamine-1-phosphate-uridyltransferase/glucosamine-1-phosphate-acetyltransferase GlmU-like protein